MSHLLSGTEADRFAADGYLVLPGVVSEQGIESLRSEAENLLTALLAEMSATASDNPRVTWWRLDSGQPYVLKVKPVVDLSSAAAALASSPELTGVVGVLLGGPPELMEDKVMYKQTVAIAADWAALPVLGEEVRKHTDAAYFAARGYHRVLTVAVCLDECTPEAGALRVWPGTHRRPIQIVDTQRQGPVVPDEVAPDADSVTLTAAPGTLLIWDAALVHASGPNTSGLPRRLLILGYAPARETS